MRTYNVGILGATGAVGQKFINLLQGHPWFRVTELGASERSAGKPYKEAVTWIEPIDLPEEIANKTIQPCRPEVLKQVDFVFSGLDSGVATEIEQSFAEAGIPVISNAKNFRQDETVPLLVPEVNHDHIKLISKQKFTSDQSGFIVTNPNCVCIPLTMAIAPLHQEFGVSSIVMTTLQAISGGGYPGVPGMDITANVMPYISDEEPKIGQEPLKILGKLNNGSIEMADIPVESTATRVPTIEGHLLSVTATFNKKPRDAEHAKEVLRNWKNPLTDYNLPSAPKHPLKIYDDPRFPQPRLHSYREGGMQVGIGRVRDASVMDLSMLILGHNTVRGAAGCSILNAELLAVENYIK